MEAVKENKMGTQPMFRLIMSMSLPAMFSMLVQSLYNVVDSYFVAKLGQDALTAVSLVFPLQTLMIAFAVGTGIGINSLVSRRLGEKRQQDADLAASNGLTLAIFTSVVFAILGLLFVEPFVGAFASGSANVYQMGCDYAYIVTIVSFGCFVEINMEKTLQATGNMFFPMLFQLSGAIVNIILDPILIFGWLGFPEMRVAGAAIATVVGQILSMIFSIIVVFAKSHDVKITLKGMIPNWNTIKEIYRVGIPSIIMQSISAFLTTLLNLILIGFSEAAVSVLGVYYKLQSFVFMPVFGLTHGLMPIMGFNYGAQKKKRIYSAMKIGTIIAVAIMLLGTLLFEFFPGELLMIFDASQEMLDIGIIAFRLVAICFIPAAVGIISSTLFQAIGMGSKSLVISLLRQLAVILPAAWLFSLIGLDYVWLAFPLAVIIALILAIIMMIGVFRKTINVLPDHAD